MLANGKNLIGFSEWENPKSTFNTVNPLTEKSNPIAFHSATEEQTEQALQVANQAFKEYSTTSYLHRIEFFESIQKHILGLGADLIDMYVEESGLSFQRALSERKRTLWQIDLFIDTLKKGHWVKASIDQAIKERKPLAKPDIRKYLEPLGPVVVFGSSNFPLAYSTAGGDTISALASGCPVIVKSHPMHAGTGELVGRAIILAAKSTQMPEGVFSNLNCDTFKTGSILVKDYRIKAVGFTGSIKGGVAITQMANNRSEPIPVFAEMGSINPVIIFPEALSARTDQIIQDLGNSISLDAGQFCTNPGLLFIIKGSYSEAFKTLLTSTLNEKQGECMVHPQIKENYDSNSTFVLGSHQVNKLTNEGDSLPPNHIKPILSLINGKDFIENPQLIHEVFGSFSLIIECENANELDNAINCLNGQLTGTIISDEAELANYSDIIQTLKNKVGRLIFNGVPTGVEVCHSMHHGGPFPATSNSHFTAVGPDAIIRWTRPVCFQNWPNSELPDALKNENPLEIMRIIDGEWSNRNL